MGMVPMRQACTEDIPIVHQMQVDWETEAITGGFSADPVETIADAIGPYFLVTEADSRIVGFVSASIRVSEDAGFFPDGQEFVCIDELYVRPEYRSQGIGRRLVQGIFEHAKREGINRFALTSNTKDFERVVEFYRSSGFRTWNVTMFRDETEADKAM